MERTTMQVDGRSHLLAQGQDLQEIKRGTVEAIRAGGDLVQVTVVGNRVLDILVSQGVSVTFETLSVPDDPRDDGDLAAPFDFTDLGEYGL
jgi:hypothetical protein